MALNLDKMKGQIPKELRNKWFFYFLVSSAISLICFSLIKSPPLNTISLFLLIVSLFYYNIRVKSEDFFQYFIKWTYFVLILLLGFSYGLIIYFNIIDTAAFMLIIAISVILLSFVVINILNLWNSRKPILIIISYLLLAISVILSFSLLFTGSDIRWLKDNSKVSNWWDFVYFSASLFYANTFGDILPFGYSRLLVILELAFSFIIHIIILGTVVNSYNGKNEKDAAKN